MKLGQRGSIHTIVLLLVMICGFGIALGWPQYKKHQTVAAAQRAVDLGKALAYSESVYKEHHGAYTPDFTRLGVDLPCPVTRSAEQVEMTCAHYTYTLEGSQLRVQHNKLPKWFVVDVENGAVDCSHEEGSLAGSHICARVDLGPASVR